MNPEDTVEEYLLMWKENQSMFLRKNKTVYKEMKLQICKKQEKKSINGIYKL